MEQKPNTAVKVFGWIVIILVLLGSLFKINHWPGASIFLILTPFFVLFFYLPLWLGAAWKEKKERFFIVVQFLFFFLYTTWFVLKVQHLNGAAMLSNLMYWGCLFVLIPVSLFKVIRAGKLSLFKFSNLVLFIFIVAAMQTNLIRMSETNVGANALILSSTQSEANYARAKLKCTQLYNAFEQLGQKNENDYYKKSQILKGYSDSLEHYMHAFKTNLMRTLDEGRTDVDFDTLSISQIWAKVNSRIPTQLITGEDETKPIHGKFSGFELQEKISSYRDSVVKFAEEDNRAFLISGINLNTNETIGEDEEKHNWIITNFYNLPAITVLMTLTNLEYEIKNAETLVLTDLLNSASKNSKDNLAAKIADLGYKLESEKKIREIENLQKDKELSEARIDAKNAEIAERDSTIIWFILVLMAFVVMLFFIIRSSFIRKQTNKLLQKQKEEIELQKVLVEEKNHEITDSINYAKRIQSSILPPIEEIKSALPNSFVLFKPKDIVSGDFYWFYKTNDSILLAAADCTGHGVPGAFMSMLNSDKLNEAAANSSDVSQILQLVNIGLKKALRQSNKEDSTRDGMDIALISFNKETTTLEYSGANRPIWIIRNGKTEIEETKATKVAIGGLTEDEQKFTKHTLELQKGDTVYIFTDGFADQFSPDDKKLMTKKFKETLYLIQDKTMEEQKAFLENFIENWKGNMEQTDDILVIGVRV